MRLAAVEVDRVWSIGVVSADHKKVAVLDAGLGTVDDVVRGGPQALAAVRAAAAGAPEVPLSGVTLGAPLQRYNRDVLCTGWNYVDHFYESAGKREGQEPASLPEHPTFFTKGPDTVIGPTDPIAFDPLLSAKWDYEAEVAIVIGKDGRSIPVEDAMDHVFGYLLANDVSQRDLQRVHGGQWLKGKSIDATMPIGPWVTTPEDVDDPLNLPIECHLNGVVMQKASTADMHFSYAEIIAELSAGMTLRAGDLVLTGTPSGIGNAREPAVFLDDGDELITRSEPLGVLRNRVRYLRLT
jgi:2-keto-4-pentenoate hydratase/2-oxohepta-3-ene-1,7-dioic acid hydratase in catechol pathway